MMNPVKILLLLVFYLGLVHADAQKCRGEGKTCLPIPLPGQLSCCAGLKCVHAKEDNTLFRCENVTCQAYLEPCGKRIKNDCCGDLKCKTHGDKELLGLCLR